MKKTNYIIPNSKELKIVSIALSIVLFITYIPNDLLKNWLFILFVVVEFYAVTRALKKRSKRNILINSLLIGTFILMVVAIVLNILMF